MTQVYLVSIANFKKEPDSLYLTTEKTPSRSDLDEALGDHCRCEYGSSYYASISKILGITRLADE